MKIDNVHEIKTTRDYGREITKEEVSAIREALLPLGWDTTFGFHPDCDSSMKASEMTVGLMAIKPDPEEGIAR